MKRKTMGKKRKYVLMQKYNEYINRIIILIYYYCCCYQYQIILDQKKKFEDRIKKLENEISQLKLKYKNKDKTYSMSKNQNDNLIKNLKNNIENLKSTK